MLSVKEILDFFLCKDFFLRGLFLGVGFCSVYTVPLARHNVRKHDQCSHLGKTIDALIIDDSF